MKSTPTKLIFSCVLIALTSLSTNAQDLKTTGFVQLLPAYQGKIELTASDVTVYLNGPSDRWFAMGFNAQTMTLGTDVIYYANGSNGVGIYDGRLVGFAAPVADEIQDWQVLSNIVNGTTREIIATRPLNSGDALDYIFSFDLNSLNIIYSHGATASTNLEYHQFNRGITTVQFEEVQNPICTANGGTLATAATRSYCVGTGSPQGISVQVTGASGTNQRWGLINAAGDVVAFRSNNSNFNLDIYPPGNYTIRYIRYENDVNIASVSNISDVANLTGCYGISSNAINLFLRPEPTGGILSANTATTVCTGGGAASIVQVALTGATGENFRYGVVAQSLGNQVVQNQANANVNFSSFAPGTYRIFNISFQQGVSLVGVEFQSDLQGCYDLSNPVVVTVENCLAAELSSAPNPTSGTSFATFTNPREEYATLEVYDMSGRMVRRLFNQVTIADQPYRIEFDGNGLSNGVYLYRLTTDSEVVVDKFMIAR